MQNRGAHLGINLGPLILLSFFAGVWGRAFILDLTQQASLLELIYHLAGFAWGTLLKTVRRRLETDTGSISKQNG